jgi:hypothetical protein
MRLAINYAASVIWAAVLAVWMWSRFDPANAM